MWNQSLGKQEEYFSTRKGDQDFTNGLKFCKVRTKYFTYKGQSFETGGFKVYKITKLYVVNTVLNF